jgi:hypothetical protein
MAKAGRGGHLVTVLSNRDMASDRAGERRHQKPDPTSTGIPGFGLEAVLRWWT